MRILHVVLIIILCQLFIQSSKGYHVGDSINVTKTNPRKGKFLFDAFFGLEQAAFGDDDEDDSENSLKHCNCGEFIINFSRFIAYNELLMNPIKFQVKKVTRLTLSITTQHSNTHFIFICQFHFPIINNSEIYSYCISFFFSISSPATYKKCTFLTRRKDLRDHDANITKLIYIYIYFLHTIFSVVVKNFTTFSICTKRHIYHFSQCMCFYHTLQLVIANFSLHKITL